MDNNTAKKAKGLVMMSGGLDSQLAACVLRDQGAHVEGIVFESPFFGSAAARKAASALGITLHVVDFTADILQLVDAPPHGFGSAINPCIDCHARMILRAAEIMERMGFDFIATGEVLNQRPMSQNRQSLGVVARDSGIPDRLIRPLCAKLLEPSLPEREGIVDRERLLAISGRSRKEQMELAAKFGIVDYPSPAGGCVLTDKGFAKRFRDLQSHEGAGDLRLVRLLRHGRHFRLPGGSKCILGRDRGDNQSLRDFEDTGSDIRIHPVNVPGPTVLMPLGARTDGDLETAVALCADYSDRRDDGAAIEMRIVVCGAESVRMVSQSGDRERYRGFLL